MFLGFGIDVCWEDKVVLSRDLESVRVMGFSYVLIVFLYYIYRSICEIVF